MKHKARCLEEKHQSGKESQHGNRDREGGGTSEASASTDLIVVQGVRERVELEERDGGGVGTQVRDVLSNDGVEEVTREELEKFLGGREDFCDVGTNGETSTVHSRLNGCALISTTGGRGEESARYGLILASSEDLVDSTRANTNHFITLLGEEVVDTLVVNGPLV